MRKYQQAWELLKKDRKVTLRVPPALVRQVKKGMIKEKDSDITFKFNNDGEEVRLTIAYDEKSFQLSFILRTKFGISDLVI